MQSKKILFITLTILFLSAVALPARAAILPTCATDVNAVLQLSCAIQLLLSVSQWILGITGSLALLFFVYGGFLFLTSRGSSSQVEKGKTVLTQATIGIIIIFGAYLAINFLVANVLKAKFTTEIPKEAIPAQQAPAPTSPTEATIPCECITAVAIPGGTINPANNILLQSTGILVSSICSTVTKGTITGTVDKDGNRLYACSLKTTTQATCVNMASNLLKAYEAYGGSAVNFGVACTTK